jgi:hypothetical protein
MVTCWQGKFCLPAAGRYPVNQFQEVPQMTRKHFAALAAAISRIEDYRERRRAAVLIAEVCRQFNSGFSYSRFYDACHATEEQFDLADNSR